MVGLLRAGFQFFVVRWCVLLGAAWARLLPRPTLRVAGRLPTSGDPRLYVCQAPDALICVSPCGSILGPFWVHLGSILGPFWVHFGSILGPFWVHFGSIILIV